MRLNARISLRSTLIAIAIAAVIVTATLEPKIRQRLELSFWLHAIKPEVKPFFI